MLSGTVTFDNCGLENLGTCHVENQRSVKHHRRRDWMGCVNDTYSVPTNQTIINWQQIITMGESLHSSSLFLSGGNGKLYCEFFSIIIAKFSTRFVPLFTDTYKFVYSRETFFFSLICPKIVPKTGCKQ